MKPAGYSFLVENLNLKVLPNWHKSFIWDKTILFNETENDTVIDYFPQKYLLDDKISTHLEFALRYDGINLNCLALIFAAIEENTIIDYIISKPTGKYARKLWFLYEFLTHKTLPISDLTKGNYVEILEPDKYYAVKNGIKINRQRIVNNLLGPVSFCPIVRKTDLLLEERITELKTKCANIINSYPPELLKKAVLYFHNKETKSSFKIENSSPDNARTAKFIGLLELADKKDFCTKELLIELQNKIVDHRFRENDYRTNQNYVGQSFIYQQETIHYISPKPIDLPELMEGLILCSHKIKEGDILPLIAATVIAYGFVYLHPFEDGNGRIHRFLVHNILAMQGFTPKEITLPISAVMLNDINEYDNSLEVFSKPLLKQINYKYDKAGTIDVLNDTSVFYKYMDLTRQAEYLIQFATKTIEIDLLKELNFLSDFFNIKSNLQNIVDMPDKLLDLFIHLCQQNNGKLSPKKRISHFSFLTEDEVKEMEEAVSGFYFSKE
ncbi:MAG: Fic family protein [bacterium]